MSPTTATRRNVVIVAAALSVLAAVVNIVSDAGFGSASQSIANGAFVAVGALILIRRPGNAIGPLLMAFGLAFQVQLALYSLGGRVAMSDVALGGWLLALANMTFPAAAWLMVPLLLLFPSGRSSSPWVRRVLLLSGVVALGASFTSLLVTPESVLDDGLSVPHPFVDAGTAEAMRGVSQVLVGVLLLVLVASAATLIVKWRRGDAIERRQVGWLALAALSYTILATANTVAQQQLGLIGDDAFLLVDAIGVVLIPIAIAIAIMRYGLYEIDTIVNRSLIFGTLAAFIGGVYITIVVGTSALLGSERSFELSILATILIALLFQPVRQWVVRWADRVVYGERATPYEVLQQFSRRASDDDDLALVERIPHLIADGCGAAEAAVWLRSGDAFRTASVWPAEAPARTVAGGAEFDDPAADFAQPVFHDGELLGGISLVKAPGEGMTDQDAALLGSLASGLGIALRNARLTTDLRDRVVELEASRQRVLSAADAARRALESDLDRGAQQLLVAIKVKLGPMRIRAERAEAPKTATLLAGLEQQAGDAIRSVRDFAAGVYPPLLEAEGLAVAVAQQASTAALSVEVHAEGISRYPREVEAAVYFSILEALQNTAKYARADRATVELCDDGDALHFSVRDDGAGFDPGATARGAGLDGMVDRLDTVGGRVTIDSAPGAGTTVSGTVPVAVRAGT